MQSFKNARALANALRVDQPQSGLDTTYQQINPQIIIQQGEIDEQRVIEPSAISESPGTKDPITEELKRLDADVKHGLLDRTGDGANANIIKLGEELKKVADGIKNISTGTSKIGAREIQYDDERLSAIRMQGERYIPGMRESLGFGQGNSFSGLKNLFSLSPLKDFKMEDIDDRSLFGGAIKRRMAEQQYVEDQLSMIKNTKGHVQEDIQKQKRYQDEQGQFSETLFRQRKSERFRQQNRLRGEISKTMEEIDRLKHDEGYTDEQIKKTGLYKTLHKQEARLSLVDPERFGKEVRAVKRKDYEQQVAERKGTPLQSATPTSATSATPQQIISTDTLQTSPMDISEKESEQILVTSQQINLLKQIEENTRHLKDLGTILKSAMDKNVVTGDGSSSSDGGGINIDALGSLSGTSGERGQQRKPGIGSRLKRLGKGAIGLAAKGARAALPYALPAAIAYGAAKTLDYGASTLGIGDVEIDETQDDANWQKMSTGQKIGSGIARGIESVGSFLGVESFAKEAEASRIEKETQIVGERVEPSTTIEQTIETDIKFNELAFAENDPEGYKKFIEFKESRTNQLTKQYIESNSYGGGREGRRIARTIAERRARDEAAVEFKEEIEAADAGAIKQTKISPIIVDNKQVKTMGTEPIIKISEDNIDESKIAGQYKTLASEPIIPGEPLSQKQVNTVDLFLQMGNPESNLDTDIRAAYNLTKQKVLFEKTKMDINSIEPPQDMGGQVYQESDELKSAERVSAQQSQPSTNIVNAPTTNVNQTTNNVTRPPARNTDSTYREYSKSRFAW